MKKFCGIITILWLILFVTGNSGIAKSANSYQENKKNTKISADENTVYKDESGNVITEADFMKSIAQGGYTMKPIMKDGKIAELRLLKRDSPELRVGATAPEVSLKSLEGKSISLSALKGKVVVLNFWFTACAPCVTEMPELNKIVEKYKDRGDVVFLAVTADSSAEINGFLKKHPFEYQILADAASAVDKYSIIAFPTHMIIGKDGSIKQKFSGYSPATVPSLDSDIASVLADRPVSQSQANHLENEVGKQVKRVFKNEQGEIIDSAKALEMIKSQEYVAEKKVDSDGNSYVLLTKKK